MKLRVGVAIAAVLLLAGCVPATDAANPPPSESPDSPSATPTPTATPRPTPTPVGPEFTAKDPSLFFVDGLTDTPWGGWDTQDVNFASPSGNIGCAILGDREFNDNLWGCTIAEHDWEFERDSPDDYCFDSQVPCGAGIEASGAELPHPRKRGDPGYPGAFVTYGNTGVIRVLEYGQSVTFGDVTCYSQEIGITCESAVSGHGFVIARDRNDIY